MIRSPAALTCDIQLWVLPQERVAHLARGMAKAREMISPHYDVFREVR
jgi:hypothetical protein